ncbi:hypothetical protein FOA43_000641 [Brettanomyces nanus]|uniref:Protoheme IX farnesyltransferase, mitochondrial n=1 Tax=Eeniella nana TaxID=13502 RepID=A0A875RW32_EENNA|nr:uncharacterized protein FOA43_000641 [Brettanomyces nanus]QPG73331.1 hypothetical protein FOA43_000641 [Brettanomyces nanus]
MWKVRLGNRLLATRANVRGLSYSTKSYSANFYYANGILNATNFANRNSGKYSIQFTPNYRLITGVSQRKTKAAVHAVEQHIERADLGFCHPVPRKESAETTSQIPFGVKPRKSAHIQGLSVVQRCLAGEKLSWKQISVPYFMLAKPHLTFLIMLSSTCSYVLAPGPTNVAAFLCLTVGTILASGAANAINMGREPLFDKQMARTATRPVVTGKITSQEAYTFAAISGTAGCAILYFGVNPSVAGLGLLNIMLYSWIYTSLKRKSILNTWIGAIVGAIPPLMGWAACSSLMDPGAWLLASMLYAWQFPHFNSLSHNLRTEYKRAGYVMTAFVNPQLNARVALRYSLLMFPICIGMSYFGVCDKYFSLDSSIFNGYLSYRSFMFWWQQHKNYSRATLAAGGPTKEAIAKASIYARKTFWGSIWQLPVVLALMMLHKQGQWDRFFHREEDEESSRKPHEFSG